MLANRALFDSAHIARGLRLTDKFHVSAKRDPIDPPARVSLVFALKKRLSETNRKRLRGPAKCARGQIMSQLMDNHDDAKQQQHRDQEQWPLCQNTTHNP